MNYGFFIILGMLILVIIFLWLAKREADKMAKRGWKN